MKRDRGVRADYVECAFRQPLAHVGRDTSKVDQAERERELENAKASLEKMQASRPLAPPGKAPALRSATTTELVALFEKHLRNPGTEAELQLEIARLLEREKIRFAREVRLSARDRIDFMVGSIGVEVKVGGGPAALIRQLFRYSEVEAVSELLVVTAKARLAGVPDEMNGKRITIAALRAGFF